MNITYREFIYSILLGARYVDAQHPYMRAEQSVMSMWEFDNEAVSYVPHEHRNTRNAGALMFEVLLMNGESREEQRMVLQ